MSAAMQGWLDKKSGGKEGKSKSAFLEKWDKRWFVLIGTTLRYYKSDEDYRKAKEPAGLIECAGAQLFLKEVKGAAFRFTIQASDRELKLRAPNAAAYYAWSDALSPIVATTGRDSSVSVDARPSERDAPTTRAHASSSVSGGGAIFPSDTDPPPTCAGWLDKKSGGKEGHAKASWLEKWDKRYFLLVGSQMRYYKHEDDHGKHKPSLGSLEIAGARLFLKEVKGSSFRFTVQNHSRELKLRADNAAEYQKWTRALGPLVNQNTEELILTQSERAFEGAEAPAAPPDAGRSRTNTLDVMANSLFDEIDTERKAPPDPWADDAGAPLREDGEGIDGSSSDDGIGKGSAPSFKLGEGGFAKAGASAGVSLSGDASPFSQGSVQTASPVIVPSSKAEAPADLDNPRFSLDQRLGDGSDDDDDDDDDHEDDGEAPNAANPFGDDASAVKPSPSSPKRPSMTDQLMGMLTPRLSLGTLNPFGGSPEGGGGGRGASTSSAAPTGGVSAPGGAAANPFGDDDGGAPPEPSSASNPFGDEPSAPHEAKPVMAANPFGDEPASSAGPPPAAKPAAARALNPFGGPEIDADDDFDAAAFAAAAGLGACVAKAATSPVDVDNSQLGGAGVASLSAEMGPPFKIIIVGDSGVGKTCLLLRFTEGRYDANQRATVAVDISNAALDLGSSTVGLALWDTAGQERFASLSAPYFRQSDGVVVVFDVGKRATYDRVKSYWMDELFFKADPEVCCRAAPPGLDGAVLARVCACAVALCIAPRV